MNSHAVYTVLAQVLSMLQLSVATQQLNDLALVSARQKKLVPSKPAKSTALSKLLNKTKATLDQKTDLETDEKLN